MLATDRYKRRFSFHFISFHFISANAIKSICVDQTPIRLPSHGYVTSQNYPDDYYNGRACQRALVGREGQMITITMFDLEVGLDFVIAN